MTIFEYQNYRDYLTEILAKDGQRSGARKNMAEAIRVHTTHVSQVLKGRAEFSLEQAEAINTFLGHTDDEGEYFINLVLKDRASNPKLKQRFATRLKQARDARLKISKRINADTEISDKDREKFYSSALYGATHVLCSIPEIDTVDALSHALRLSRSQTAEIVDFLLRIGLLTNKSGRLAPGAKHVHLNNETEMILKHHANWRMHTINNLQFLDSDDLHYSAALSISQDGAYAAKEILLGALKQIVEVVGKSKSEVAYVLGFDFYKLISR